MIESPPQQPRQPSRTAGLTALLVAVALAGENVAAQRGVRVRVPSAKPAADPEAAFGPKPRLATDPNVDRFLRRAEELVERAQHEAAIEVLQDVLEGRTVQMETGQQGTGQPGTGEPSAGAQATTGPQGPTRAESTTGPAVDSSRAMFSADGRLFRPVDQLCHRRLSELPAEGRALYESRYGGPAQQALDLARESGSIAGLRAVSRRYFITPAGATALLLAGDLLLDRGDAAAALRAFRDLAEQVPLDIRQRAQIDEGFLQIRIATALELSGLDQEAAETLTGVSQGSSRALRIAGEIQSLDDLRETGVLGTFGVEPEVTSDPRFDAAAWSSGEGRLITLWEQRFTDQRPYRPAQPGAQQRVVVQVRRSGGNGRLLLPFRDEVPGTWVSPVENRIWLLDHQRPFAIDAMTGRLDSRGVGLGRPPAPKPGETRTRVPILDHIARRIVPSARHLHAVLLASEHGNDALLSARLVTWSHEGAGLKAVWDSAQIPDTRDLTFLAAPTVHGSLLIAPVLNRGEFEVVAVDAETGSLRWRTPLHNGGTDYMRPATPPLTVSGGTVHVMTNAGVAAALDADSGALAWARRYERTHPDRLPRAGAGSMTNRSNPFSGVVLDSRSLPGFAPTAPIVADDLVIYAPSDGDVLLALRVEDGGVAWMLPRVIAGSRDSNSHRFDLVIGRDGDRLVLGGPDQLTVVDLATGVRLWRSHVPGHASSRRWRGRGLVADGHVFLPGDGAILARSLEESSAWVRLELPRARPEQEPLRGAFDLFRSGPLLIAAFEGGVLGLALEPTLVSLAEGSDDPREQARLLTLAGRSAEALDLLLGTETGERDRAVMVGLAQELAFESAANQNRAEAFGVLDRLMRIVEEPRLRRRLLLARADVHRLLGDPQAYRETLLRLDGRSDREEDR